MGTRNLVGFLRQDGKVEYSYFQYDGDICTRGAELFPLKSIEAVKEYCKKNVHHDNDYAMICSRNDYIVDGDIEYVYLYDPKEKKWQVASTHEPCVEKFNKILNDFKKGRIDQEPLDLPCSWEDYHLIENEMDESWKALGKCVPDELNKNLVDLDVMLAIDLPRQIDYIRKQREMYPDDSSYLGKIFKERKEYLDELNKDSIGNGWLSKESFIKAAELENDWDTPVEWVNQCLSKYADLVPEAKKKREERLLNEEEHSKLVTEYGLKDTAKLVKKAIKEEFGNEFEKISVTTSSFYEKMDVKIITKDGDPDWKLSQKITDFVKERFPAYQEITDPENKERFVKYNCRTYDTFVDTRAARLENTNIKVNQVVHSNNRVKF